MRAYIRYQVSYNALLIRQWMICLLHCNQPGINADTTVDEFTVVGPPSGAQFLSQGAELAGEVSLWLLLEFTLPEKEEVCFS